MRVVDQIQILHLVTAWIEREEIHHFERDKSAIPDSLIILKISSCVMLVSCT